MSEQNPGQLALLGDLHGDPRALVQLDRMLEPGMAILQVGDFGWYPHLADQWRAIGSALRRRVYWIRGNHEHYPSIHWLDARRPVETAPNIVFIPDGCVLELGGLKIGCIGGAASIDYRARRLGIDWFHEENITKEQAERTERWTEIDLMVSHVPPQHVITPSANPLAKRLFGVPDSWRDINADIVETIWRRIGCPPLVCGHMHYAYQSTDGVRVLDIAEALVWPPPAQRLAERDRA